MSSRFKEVVGLVDDVVIFEQETFDVLLADHQDKFTIVKAVKLNLKDYNHGKSVTILKIRREGKSILLLSDHLTYQSHVPF